MMSGNVETVLGKLDPSSLGRTLTHEHLALNFSTFYVPPPEGCECFFEGKIELRNVGFVKQYPYSSAYNVTFHDADTAAAVLEDIRCFREFGGGTIVENTSHGIERDIPLMKKIAKETGVNVIAGTGHYVAAVQKPETLNMTVEKMYELYVKELTIGCEGDPDGTKAGFIGEVGSAWPIEVFEKRAIQATGEVQAQLRCPVTFHPGRDSDAPAEIMRIYREAGGDARRAILSHLDRTLGDEQKLLEFADENDCYCQFDLFGLECSYYQLKPSVDMPSDAQRMDRVKLLRDDGKLNRVLLSHDIHTKHRLINFGGHGYGHILKNILPRLKLKGFTENEIDLLTIENPKSWLTGSYVEHSH